MIDEEGKKLVFNEEGIPIEDKREDKEENKRRRNSNENEGKGIKPIITKKTKRNKLNSQQYRLVQLRNEKGEIIRIVDNDEIIKKHGNPINNQNTNILLLGIKKCIHEDYDKDKTSLY
ncbi:hypothetical protein EDI_017110 [Entamoeba dispar SAW760]|uniref:Uncharacterized protein n=1 Tax=Entamoeba dispar (strain ATCC PRA-260 / SAW760) TaxID=370354 RepID=B0EAP1_ENTDS|nr:uncharacterized protein EDI_017110 [Entamoeba dispar SAW760]EDR28390.1 hypothetical protein EDI_017110 [Entamoeba dispar SAW760]|eukprot:EDR28390.1 hypothetical protein EDI_017110 [Entamoeba dispar SAW760]